MPYVNGQYYETKKQKEEIINSRNPSKSSSSSSASRPSSRGSSYNSGGSSASRPSSGGSSYSSSGSSSRPSSGGSYVPGGALGLAGALAGGLAANALKNKTGGGSSSSGSRAPSGGSSYSGGYASDNRNYHQEAQDAAARGDWNAVTKALAARQAKIDAQGGNDRGASNAQILSSLQNQYRNIYNALPSAMRDTLGMAASGQLNGRGWEDGHDYLAEAQAYARAGDLDAAYDALRRRGFKMYDTGAAGGGTGQDQAYAMIQRLFDQGAGGAAEYQRALADNARLLAEHPTQFGTGVNPSLASKHFVSADGQYIIYYDSNGAPMRAQPNNGQYGSTKYTPEYRGLMERYYGGSGDYADLRRQLHNLDVVHSGNGRLIDQDWNWASGEAAPLTSWADWDPSAISTRNAGQDKDLLANLLTRVNQGETFSSPAQVPVVRRAEAYDDLAVSGGRSGGGSSRASGSPSTGGGNGLVSSSGDYTGMDLTQYIRDMYQQNLAAQLAGLQSSYEQNRAAIEAQNSQIGQNYYNQRNQAAAQNDLQRMYMAELGNYQGLNTGASGQLALAQGMALQNGLSTLGAAENQDLANNGLLLNQLQAGYLGDVNAAQASSGAQLAQALYGEYVRQLQAAEQAAAAAQAQANWEAQFNYQMQQDALDRQYQQEAADMEYRRQLQQLEAAAQKQGASNAWDYAQLLLRNGVVPDEATLYAAGLDLFSAQALAESYKWQLGQKYKTKSTSSGSSGGSSAGKPRLTYAQAKAAIEDGQATDAAIQAYDYYMGRGAYENAYGTPDSGKLGAYIQGVNTALTNGNTQAADGYLRSIWGNLSSREKEQMQAVLSSYGIQYAP